MPSPAITGSDLLSPDPSAKEASGELWCGIDPGVTGALAFLRMGRVRPLIEAMVPMPVTVDPVPGKKSKKYDYDWAGVADALRHFAPARCIVEQQWPRPMEGIVSSFRSGGGYHGLLAVLQTLGLRYETVSPARWKNALGLRKQDKNLSRQLATQLMPEGRAMFARVKDHGPAEAALMVIWKARYEATPLTRSLGKRSGVRVHALADQSCRGDGPGAV